MSVKDLEIGYNQNIFARISFELYKGQKLAIIGENGKGKSTLLKTLMGYIPKIGGEYEYGYHVKKEYFDQQIDSLNPNNTVLKDISDDFPKLTQTEVRNILGTFLFTGEDVFKDIKVLSGGEKVRLQLLKVFKKEANLLLLDEPTNHMDMLGKESLENILREYKGSLIFVSHDRYFVNKVADSILAFEEDGVFYFNGNYEEYIRYRESKYTDNISNNIVKNFKTNKANNEYFRNKEKARIKNKINKIELEIEQKEVEVKRLKEELQDEANVTDYIKLNELQEKINSIERDIELQMIEWEELNSLQD